MNKKLLALAKSFGFDNYERVGKWEGHEIYVPLNSDGSCPCIGEPLFFLAKGDKIRIAAAGEWQLLMRFLKD